ncbi:RNA polymerase sigma factor [Faunimonas sp. B44]|uniref:RNA polymerase sigma factor n=1 Tax=Faunimonas sp. B44 TaxID=3461493 RepID=UPI004044EFC1
MSDAVSTREDRHEPTSELGLAERARDGDASAFRDIMQRNNTRLFRVARSVLKDDADAEDAVQESYLKAYTKLGEFRGESTLSTWLTRIVLNESLMRLRQGRRTAEITRTFEQESRSGRVVRFPGMAQGQDPEKAAATAQITRILERAVDALPIDFRVVFVMRCVQEMSVEETAEQLAIPQATVKTRLHRARLLLRRSLDEELGVSLTGTFPFGGSRCARMTEAVLARLGLTDMLPSGPNGNGDI